MRAKLRSIASTISVGEKASVKMLGTSLVKIWILFAPFSSSYLHSSRA
jgi:hypothetical protein